MLNGITAAFVLQELTTLSLRERNLGYLLHVIFLGRPPALAEFTCSRRPPRT